MVKMSTNPTTKELSADFPFKSHYINVLGAKLHYIEESTGQPLLFLHGIPASSYLWRNIIPKLSKTAHCIAPDLIGMGKSEQPKGEYHLNKLVDYLEGLIQSLELKNITLVLHGMGSIVGFHYAMRHPQNVKGIVFYESYVGKLSQLSKLSLPLQHLNAFLQNPKTGHETVMKDPLLIKKIFDTTSIRKLNAKELEAYSSPYQAAESRQILWHYIQESPFGNQAQDTLQLIDEYTHFLEKAQFPKLMLYTIPGFITSIDNIIWCRDHLPNLSLVDIGQGLHFAQEYNPAAFAKAMKDWYMNI